MPPQYTVLSVSGGSRRTYSPHGQAHKPSGKHDHANFLAGHTIHFISGAQVRSPTKDRVNLLSSSTYRAHLWMNLGIAIRNTLIQIIFNFKMVRFTSMRNTPTQMEVAHDQHSDKASPLYSYLNPSLLLWGLCAPSGQNRLQHT